MKMGIYWKKPFVYVVNLGWKKFLQIDQLKYAPGKYIPEQAARNYQPEAIP